jgi:hypothetical protein
VIDREAPAPRCHRAVERALFLLVLVTGAFFVQGGSWSPNARFDQIRSVVERGTFDCAPLQYNSGDLIERGGVWLPYKAPGISFLGIPAWAALHWASSGALARSREGLGLGAYVVTLWTTTLPVACAAIAFFRFGCRVRPGDARAAAVVTLLAFCGTLLLPISTLMLGHATAAALCWIAFVVAIGGDPAPAPAPGARPARARRADLLAGLLLGGAIAVDYLALPVAAAIATLAAARGGARRLGALAAGAAPPLAALALYHWAFFGAPWRIAYSTPLDAFASPGALGGLFVAPSARVVWHTTFGPYRGVFFSSPFLLAGLAGLAFGWRRAPALRGALVLSALVVAIHLAFLWTFNGWHGGWTCGARYFVPAIPFLAWPAALLEGRARRVAWGLGAISVAMMLIATAVNPQTPNADEAAGRPRPWSDYLVPAFLRGDVADHVQSIDERHPDLRYWPWGRRLVIPDAEARRAMDADFPPERFNPRSRAVAGAATNWGLAIGLRGLWSLLPLAAIWAIGALALTPAGARRRSARRSRATPSPPARAH